MMRVNEGLRSLQERFESTRIGRVLISVFVLAVSVALLSANLPASRLQDRLLRADHYFVYGAALDQSWEVFAPDPRSETIEVIVRVTFADGSHAIWRVPRRNPVIGEYTDYRWLKWAEYVVSPAYMDLSKPIALYVARKLASPTRRPVKVSLTNRWYDLKPPGQIPDHPFIQQRTFYKTRITEAMLKS